MNKKKQYTETKRFELLKKEYLKNDDKIFAITKKEKKK